MAEIKLPADLKTLSNGRKSPIAGVAFDRTGALLLAGGSGGYDLWNLSDGKKRFFRSPAAKSHYGCSLEPAGRWAYISDQRGFRIQAVQDKSPEVPGSEHERHVTAFDLAAEGERLVMTRGGGGDNRVECWNVSAQGAFASAWSLCDGKRIAPDEPFLYNQSQWFTNAVAICRDGKRVVTAESRKGLGVKPLLVLRDGATGKMKAEWSESATFFTMRIAFSADDKALFAWDNTMVVECSPNLDPGVMKV